MTKPALLLGLIIIVSLAIVSLALLFLPQGKIRALLKLKQDSRLWIRLVGVFGLLWVTLAAATNPDLRLVELPYQTRVILDTFRYYSGGIIMGLFLALGTKQREGCQTSG